MDRILISWKIGEGNIIISEVNGDIVISSDINTGVERELELTFRTLVGDKTATLLVILKGNRIVLRDKNGLILRDNTQKVLTAKK